MYLCNCCHGPAPLKIDDHTAANIITESKGCLYQLRYYYNLLTTPLHGVTWCLEGLAAPRKMSTFCGLPLPFNTSYLVSTYPQSLQLTLFVILFTCPQDELTPHLSLYFLQESDS